MQDTNKKSSITNESSVKWVYPYTKDEADTILSDLFPLRDLVYNTNKDLNSKLRSSGAGIYDLIQVARDLWIKDGSELFSYITKRLESVDRGYSPSSINAMQPLAAKIGAIVIPDNRSNCCVGNTYVKCRKCQQANWIDTVDSKISDHKRMLESQEFYSEIIESLEPTISRIGSNEPFDAEEIVSVFRTLNKPMPDVLTKVIKRVTSNDSKQVK